MESYWIAVAGQATVEPVLQPLNGGIVTCLVEPGEKPDVRSCLTCITVAKTDLTLDG